jgi:ABC-2 type transport system permease protein
MLRRVTPIAIKEFRQIVRDRRSLALLLFFPAFLMVLFGFALNFDVKHIALAVLDQDQTPESREFVHSFLHSEYFDLRRQLDDPRKIDELLDEGRVQAVLVVPSDFSLRLARGQEAQVQINLDGSNSNAAATVLGYANAIAQDYSSRILTDALLRTGRSNAALPIDYRPRVWYNPELKSARFLVPGLIAIILMIMTVVSTSLSIVREKERGTMEQMIVSPVQPIELILGKTVPYVFSSLVGAAVVLLVGWVLFGVAVKGSWLLLFVATLLFLIGGLGLGLLLSTLTDSQQGAYMLSALVTMLPTVILSGFVFPIRNMPVLIQAVSYLVPARCFLPILRGIILKGVGLSAFWGQILFLAGFALVMMLLSTIRLQRQMR